MYPQIAIQAVSVKGSRNNTPVKQSVTHAVLVKHHAENIRLDEGAAGSLNGSVGVGVGRFDFDGIRGLDGLPVVNAVHIGISQIGVMESIRQDSGINLVTGRTIQIQFLTPPW